MSDKYSFIVLIERKGGSRIIEHGNKIVNRQTDIGILMHWASHIIEWVDTNLNWLDLIIFLLGAGSLFVVFFIVIKKKGKKHEEEVTRLATDYEEGLLVMKKRHMREIHLAEKKVEEFRQKLLIAEADYRTCADQLKYKYKQMLEGAERRHLKQIQEVREGDEQVILNTELSVFELKKEISHLRKRQIDEVEQFQSRIKKLKSQIQKLHDNHAKEIEMCELQVADLRKQIDALMYKA